MNLLSHRLCALGAVLGAVVVSACATGNGETLGPTGTTAPSGTGGTAVTASGSVTGTGGGALVLPDGGTGGSATELDFLAYAHTGTSLYQFDPKKTSEAPVLLGEFDGADGSMTDLAVSKTGELYGVTSTSLYKLTVGDGGKVACTNKIALNSSGTSAMFYALTFVPEGVLDDSKEVLLAGNTAGELWAIDTASGALTQHGNFGKVPVTDGQGHDYPSKNQGKAWELSGDIVFLANNGKPVGFATVRDCPNPPNKSGCSLTDTLIQIDLTKLRAAGTQSVTNAVRGQILQGSSCATSASSTDFEQLLGIAAWNDKVYGFSTNGAIVEIDNSDGTACRVVSTPDLKWYGAGVTTLAPVVVPPA